MHSRQHASEPRVSFLILTSLHPNPRVSLDSHQWVGTISPSSPVADVLVGKIMTVSNVALTPYSLCTSFTMPLIIWSNLHDNPMKPTKSLSAFSS